MGESRIQRRPPGRPGERAQPMLAIAIVAAAGWLTLYAGCAAVTHEGGWGGRRDLRRGMRRFRLPSGPPDLADPALVNLVTTGCQLYGAAFAATILQLGSRRVLAISEPEPGQLWCTPTREGAGDLDLAAYERLVLADVTRQFAEAGRRACPGSRRHVLRRREGGLGSVRGGGARRRQAPRPHPGPAAPGSRGTALRGRAGRRRVRGGGRGRSQLHLVGGRVLHRHLRGGRPGLAHQRAGPG